MEPRLRAFRTVALRRFGKTPRRHPDPYCARMKFLIAEVLCLNGISAIRRTLMPRFRIIGSAVAR
jgi:hypothetical protein